MSRGRFYTAGVVIVLMIAGIGATTWTSVSLGLTRLRSAIGWESVVLGRQRRRPARPGHVGHGIPCARASHVSCVDGLEFAGDRCLRHLRNTYRGVVLLG
jgi:hypothetical protein